MQGPIHLATWGPRTVGSLASHEPKGHQRPHRDRKMPGHFTALGHQRQSPWPFQGRSLGFAVDVNPALCHRKLAGNGLQKCAFAGAVGAHQGGEAAGRQFKRQLLQHRALTTPHRQVRNVESGDRFQVVLAVATNLAIVKMKTIIAVRTHF
jgi:hypothetical protein